VRGVATADTVLGPVDVSDLGRVLHHEHLLSLTPGAWCCACTGAPPQDVGIAQVELAVRSLAKLEPFEVRTVVDLSPYGVVGRDARGTNIELLAEISRRSGMHVISGTATYLEAFSPAWAVEADLDEMTRRFIADLTEGIDGSTIRAGLLGEQATSLGEITPFEERCLRASARAHRATGAALITHTTHGTMAQEQLDLLEEEGADLGRVVIGHMDTHPDFAYVRAVLDRGVGVAFDTIGKQFWDFRVAPLPQDMPEGPFTKDAYHRADATRADRIAQLVSLGYADRLFLAQDMTGSEVYLNPDTHGQRGYAYLFTDFAEMLRDRGVGDADLDRMLIENPARLLASG
jgi:predicted metal-dependent phosphotriesterase family hydrolase